MVELGSFSLFEEKPLRELIELAHSHDVYVSTVKNPPPTFRDSPTEH